VITVRKLEGAALTRALSRLADLRITVFREWPYLYDGTLAYEQGYLDRFSKAKDAALIAAFDGDKIVGASTVAPLVGHADTFRAALEKIGLDPHQIVYFGESVLLAAYRGQGIGHRFFDLREGHARTIPDATHTAFCAVVRPDDHPMKPARYRALDPFWTRRGYAKLDGALANFAWRDVGAPAETHKPMQFWIRPLGLR
jgi:GNAT superfamily N-acetyltransferase